MDSQKMIVWSTNRRWGLKHSMFDMKATNEVEGDELGNETEGFNENNKKGEREELPFLKPLVLLEKPFR